MQKPIQEFHRVGTNVAEFSLNGKECFGRVIDIYDADTMTVIIPLFGAYYRYSVRLLGIDTPEMKSKILENKQRALRARNTVLQWVLPAARIDIERAYSRKEIQDMLEKEVTLVWLKFHEFEKYGRVLADVYMDFQSEESFSQRLIREGWAYSYNGGSKLTEEQQQSVLR